MDRTLASEELEMHEQKEFLSFLEAPARRRCWLLYRALDCLPLDRALDLARAADEFVSGPASERVCRKDSDSLETAVPPCDEGEKQPFPSVAVKQPDGENQVQKTVKVTLSDDQRDKLLDRVSAGAKNAELAVEFGISARQAQGLRMGCARKIIDKRRDRLVDEKQPAPEMRISASVDDVVRYLRQQDDVVVPQGDQAFLVNARFRLSLEELVSRANRMRTRQGKPEFKSPNHLPATQLGQPLLVANGHHS
jgi:hypothetical protein